MLGEACALLAALTWSTSVVLFKRSEAISPQGMNLFKNVAAVTLLLVTLPVVGGSVDWQRSAPDWWRLVVSGVLGIAIADTLVFMALRRLGASRLAVVETAYAPVIVALSVVWLDERIGLSFLAGAVLLIVGVLVATRRKSPLEPQLEGALGGVWLGVGGIAAMAVGVVLAKPALERGSLVEVTLVRLVAGVVGQLLWIALVPSQREALRALRPSPAWRTLLPASVLGSYVAMLLWLGGFKWASASVASVLNQMSTVFTIAMARLVLGEPITTRRALGALAAIAGALLVAL
jgi:drug/metabolite transporter (DMT)-like permease